MEHELKTWPDFFNPVLTGETNFELRYDDRGFHAGDILRLREWDRKNGYTGREIRLVVTYLLCGFPWLTKGYVAMATKPVITLESALTSSAEGKDGAP